MIATDTNFLIYAFSRRAPEHRAAWRAIDKARNDPRGWGIALPSIAEFWTVVSRTDRPQPVSGEDARAFIHALIVEVGAAVWTLPAGSWERLVRLAVDLGVRGRRIFDLQIALAAFEKLL